MGASNLGVCANIFRFVFVIVNALFALLGIAILGGGIYLIVTARDYEAITGNSYVSGAALIITAGAITMLIAGVGCLGALFKWRPLLGLYVIIIAFIILLEIIAAILGFVFHGKVENRYEENLENAFEKYTSPDDDDYDESNNEAVDFIQKNLECCGIRDGPVDWGTFNPEYVNTYGLPDSCNCTDDDNDNCLPVSFNYTVNDVNMTFTSDGNVWNEGCYDNTVRLGKSVGVAIGTTGLVVGLVEVTGIIVAIGLVFCITKTRSEYQVV